MLSRPDPSRFNPLNRISGHFQARSAEELVDASAGFCEQQEEVEKLKMEAISAIDGLVMLKNVKAIRELSEELVDAAIKVARSLGISN